MRRLIFSVACAAAGLLFCCHQAAAQIAGLQPVLCTNCSTAETQLLELAKDVEAVAQQIQIAENTINTYENLVINTANLPGRLINDITSPIRTLQALVQRASLLGENAKFMLANLGHAGGWGGSLADIPAALAQEDNALAMAAQQLGLASQQVNTLSAQCASQASSGADGAFAAGGIKAAVQGGTELAATSTQCAESRLQLQTAGFQAMVTAEVRRADRESMIAAKVQMDRSNAIAAMCSQLTAIAAPPVCTQQPAAGGGGAAPAGAPGLIAPGGGNLVAANTPLPEGGVISGAQAEAINAAPASAAVNDGLAAAVNAAPNSP